MEGSRPAAARAPTAAGSRGSAGPEPHSLHPATDDARRPPAEAAATAGAAAAAGFRSIHAAAAAAQAAQAAADRIEAKLYGSGSSSQAGGPSSLGGSRPGEECAAGGRASLPLAAEMPAGPAGESSPYHT